VINLSDRFLMALSGGRMNCNYLPLVYSMYWNNVAPVVRDGQKSVFSHLGIELIQENADQKPHGSWMEEVLNRHQANDIVVFCDIDAFPLSRQAYLNAVAHAEQGAVFGLAQFSNHKKTQDVYAGPMFMAFRKDCWEALGKPGMSSNKQYDAAEALSIRAREQGVPLVMASPTSCLIPKWPLADKGLFGIGTFYGDCEFFHLFESRKPQYEKIFSAIVADVVSDQKLNFSKYLSIVDELNGAPVPERKRNWIPKPLRRFLV